MHHNQIEFITRTQKRLIICKSLNVKYNINRLKDKIHMINSIDTKNRAFNRFQYSFIIKYSMDWIQKEYSIKNLKRPSRVYSKLISYAMREG